MKTKYLFIALSTKKYMDSGIQKNIEWILCDKMDSKVCCFGFHYFSMTIQKWILHFFNSKKNYSAYFIYMSADNISSKNILNTRKYDRFRSNQNVNMETIWNFNNHYHYHSFVLNICIKWLPKKYICKAVEFTNCGWLYVLFGDCEKWWSKLIYVSLQRFKSDSFFDLFFFYHNDRVFLKI